MTTDRPDGERTRPRIPLKWAGTIAAPLVVALALLLAGAIFDVPAFKDLIHSTARPADKDVRLTVRHEDPGFDLALPSGVELTARQKRLLTHWSLHSADPTGDLGRLIAELRAEGGANPNELPLRITLEGRRNQPINVDDVRPVDIRRFKPYDGTFVSIPPQEPGETVKMMFNFDEVNPRARVAVGSEGDVRPGGLFFEEKTLTIRNAQQDALAIKSIATRWAVTFKIRVDYRVGGATGHLTVADHGRPFALTPMNCADHTRLAESGQPISSGHASYRHIWRLDGDFRGIHPVRRPDRFELGVPYC